jgi:hypothetical protein
MGNKFGSYLSHNTAEDYLLKRGFVYSAQLGYFTKMDKTSGSLTEAPTEKLCKVEITSYKVLGKFSATGKDYLVYQHHFIS